MISKSIPRAGNLMTRVLGSFILAIAAFALFSVFLPSNVTPPQNSVEKEPATQGISRQCEEELESLIEALSPGRLGISSDRVTLIHRLNAWWKDCGKINNLPATEPAVEFARQALSGETLTRTLSETFLPEDTSHIRNSLLMREIVARVTDGQPSNVDRYVALFNFVCRYQFLIPDQELTNFPMTTYESLVYGMGSPEHRAWTLCELLRQMRVDVVILTPTGEGLEKHWLIGVIAPTTGVLLFDPRLGMALPGPDDDAQKDDTQKSAVATLAQALESDAPFRKLDLPDNPYPLKSDDLKSLKVGIIGTSCSWAPRMAQLQFLLPTKSSAELYDGLSESELRSPGLQKRVIDAGQGIAGQGIAWKAEDVVLWDFPEQQLIALESNRGEGEQGSMLQSFQTIFRGPYIPHPTDDKGNFQMVPIGKSLHFVRVEQLRGNQTAALKDYLPIRSAAKLAATPPNEYAAEYATLWTGLAQYETRKYNAAFQTLGRFVSGQASGAGLMRAGFEIGADCMLAEKQYLPAVEILEKAPPGMTPRRDELLIRRWKRLGGVDPDKQEEKPAAEEKKPEEMPADDDKKTEPAPEMKADEKPKPEGEMPAKPESAKPDAPTKPEEKPAPEKPESDKPEPAKPEPEKPAPAEPAPEKPVEEPAVPADSNPSTN